MPSHKQLEIPTVRFRFVHAVNVTTPLSLLQAAIAGQWVSTIFKPRHYRLTNISYRYARSDAFDLWNGYAIEMDK